MNNTVKMDEIMEEINKSKYNKEEKKAFLHGYLYGKAEEMKEQNLFTDLTTKELVKLLCSEVSKNI